MNKFGKEYFDVIQWTGDNLTQVIEFTDGRPPDIKSNFADMMWEKYCDLVKSDGFKIFNCFGKTTVPINNWIVRGKTSGLLATYSPKIFQKYFDNN